MRNIILGLIIILSSTIANAAGESENLTATIIGSGSPHYSVKRASASVLISRGSTKILVDMGNGTQGNLHKLRVRTRDMSALLFTHHHLDHNEEFVPLFIRSLLGERNFSIVGPPGTVTFTETNLKLYAEDISYRLGKSRRTLAERKDSFTVRDIKGGESFDIEGIHISTIKVPHTIHTIAYRFDYKGESIVITGDLTYTKDLPKLAMGADFMIIDSGGMIIKRNRRNRSNNRNRRNRRGMNRHGKGKRERAHLNLSDSSLLAKQAKIKNLVYTHFRPGKVDKEASLKEIRKNYKGNVIFGEDLMVIGNTHK
ncbi:MAG: MBL fold metallo-hydrolase [bacterium]|nr:MBL fold metallo-hydrolase [bacterium]